MKYLQKISILILAIFIISCSNNEEKLEEKGFQVNYDSESVETDQTEGLNKDSLKFDTRPGDVLLTGIPNIRLTTIFKVNINKEKKTTFTGSNSFHYQYEDYEEDTGNNWNNHLMPGFEAVYGYNMVNVSHYDFNESRKKSFFEKPVLIKNLYYPAYSSDTLNFNPVSRDFFIVSVYNDDTNKDGFVNLKDLRRLYLFNIHGERQKALIPENYSVFRSEYDPVNDYMFVFAQLDINENGRRDESEPVHIFWIDLKDPNRSGQLY